MPKSRFPAALRRAVVLVAMTLLPAGCQVMNPEPSRAAPQFASRWDHIPEARTWTVAATEAIDEHGGALLSTVPADADVWCPGYAAQDAAGRKAFWVGLLSALAKHESTWNPEAVGGGGRWFGLVQIAPATARLYNCKATSGAALKAGGDNLSCAVRIMAHTVPRDGVVAANMRGVAADWGPFHTASKREDMATWTRAQPYCQVPKPSLRMALLGK